MLFKNKIFHILIFLGINVILVSIGSYLYLQNFQLRNQLSQTQKEVVRKNLSKEPSKEDPWELFHRCGDLPQIVHEQIKYENDNFINLKGPFWAPDCRHIAWSYNITGPSGWLGEITEEERKQLQAPRKVNELDGVYIYDDRTQNIMKIYQPLKVGEYQAFKEWVDSDKVIYIKEGTAFIYDIISGTTTPY